MLSLLSSTCIRSNRRPARRIAQWPPFLTGSPHSSDVRPNTSNLQKHHFQIRSSSPPSVLSAAASKHQVSTTSSTIGGTNLGELLRTMEPELRSGEYVFATVTPEIFATLDLASIDCFFREAANEITVILTTEAAAKAGLEAAAPFSWITLTVHSSLEAVGLTAAFATALGAANISCNVVAAYYHDHIFVPSRDATRAVQVLRDLAIANCATN